MARAMPPRSPRLLEPLRFGARRAVLLSHPDDAERVLDLVPPLAAPGGGGEARGGVAGGARRAGPHGGGRAAPSLRGAGRAGGDATLSARVHDRPRGAARFDPDRWAGGLAERLPRFACFPFGGRPRRCIGGEFAMTEAVLVVATIARRFRLVLAPGHAVTPRPLVVLHMQDGLRMVLQRR